MRIEFETLEEFGQMIKGCNTDVNLSDNGAGADKSIIKKMIERKMIEKGAFELGDTMSTGAPENGVKKAALPPELFMGWDALDKGKKLEQLKQKDFTLFAVLMLPSGSKRGSGAAATAANEEHAIACVTHLLTQVCACALIVCMCMCV